MSIICLEGPSAVGKTTAAGLLASREGAYVIPEVNLLHRRPPDEPSNWYLERQVDRWRVAADHDDAGRVVVLDGDPFQPLWYNWAYRFRRLQSLEALQAFYRPHIVRGRLSFPDRYFVLRATAEMLHARRHADATRQRRGFDEHLRFIEPQSRYFEAMRSYSPDRARFVETSTLDRDFQRDLEGSSESVSRAASAGTLRSPDRLAPRPSAGLI